MSSTLGIFPRQTKSTSLLSFQRCHNSSKGGGVAATVFAVGTTSNTDQILTSSCSTGISDAKFSATGTATEKKKNNDDDNFEEE